MTWLAHGRRALVPLALSACFLAPSAAPSCDIPAGSAPAVVERVIDGDTLRLRDGRKVRLVGIDAPEMATGERLGDAFSREAYAALAAMVPSGSSVTLGHDVTRHDRYGRTLAFLFGPQGQDVQRVLLERGLATALVVPPRRYAIDCYQRAETKARSSRAGVWSIERYHGVEAARLRASARGFHVVRGEVTRIAELPSALSLSLGPAVTVRISRADLVNFAPGEGSYDPGDLLGARIEVRGWIHARRNERRLIVRHPAALSVIERH